MLTIGDAITPEAAADYYINRGEREHSNCYPELVDSAGRWSGALADHFELVGDDSSAIEETDFNRACNGADPRTNEPLVRTATAAREFVNKRGVVTTTKLRRAGYDLTLSAPKSVSLAALVGDDAQLVAAHRAASQRAIGELAKLTDARMGNVKPPVRTGAALIASFDHDAARPDRANQFAAVDLHTHNLLINLTLAPDAKFRAVEPRMLFRAQRLGTALYRAELAVELEHLGYETIVEPSSGKPEIAGIKRDYIEASSPRWQEITKTARAKNLRSTRGVAVRSRGAKDFDRCEMRERHLRLDEVFGGQARRAALMAQQRRQQQAGFDAQIPNAVGTADNLTSRFNTNSAKTIQNTAQTAVATAINDLTKRVKNQRSPVRAFYLWLDAYTAALEFGSGRTTVNAIKRALQSELTERWQIEFAANGVPVENADPVTIKISGQTKLLSQLGKQPDVQQTNEERLNEHQSNQQQSACAEPTAKPESQPPQQCRADERRGDERHANEKPAARIARPEETAEDNSATSSRSRERRRIVTTQRDDKLDEQHSGNSDDVKQDERATTASTIELRSNQEEASNGRQESRIQRDERTNVASVELHRNLHAAANSTISGETNGRRYDATELNIFINAGTARNIRVDIAASPTDKHNAAKRHQHNSGLHSNAVNQFNERCEPVVTGDGNDSIGRKPNLAVAVSSEPDNRTDVGRAFDRVYNRRRGDVARANSNFWLKRERAERSNTGSASRRYAERFVAGEPNNCDRAAVEIEDGSRECNAGLVQQERPVERHSASQSGARVTEPRPRSTGQPISDGLYNDQPFSEQTIVGQLVAEQLRGANHNFSKELLDANRNFVRHIAAVVANNTSGERFRNQSDNRKHNECVALPKEFDAGTAGSSDQSSDDRPHNSNLVGKSTDDVRGCQSKRSEAGRAVDEFRPITNDDCRFGDNARTGEAPARAQVGGTISTKAARITQTVRTARKAGELAAVVAEFNSQQSERTINTSLASTAASIETTKSSRDDDNAFASERSGDEPVYKGDGKDNSAAIPELPDRGGSYGESNGAMEAPARPETAQSTAELVPTTPVFGCDFSNDRSVPRQISYSGRGSEANAGNQASYRDEPIAEKGREGGQMPDWIPELESHQSCVSDDNDGSIHKPSSRSRNIKKHFADESLLRADASGMAVGADDCANLSYQAVTEAFDAEPMGDYDPAGINGGAADFSFNHISSDNYGNSANSSANYSTVKPGDVVDHVYSVNNGNDCISDYVAAQAAEIDAYRLKPLDRQIEEELFTRVSQPLVSSFAAIRQQLEARKVADEQQNAEQPKSSSARSEFVDRRNFVIPAAEIESFMDDLDL